MTILTTVHHPQTMVIVSRNSKGPSIQLGHPNHSGPCGPTEPMDI